MKVLVTGGLGFIGSHTALELIQNMFTRQTSINQQVQKCNSEQIETIKNYIPPEDEFDEFNK